MKRTKSRSLIYYAILVSFVALLILYALTYKNLQATLGQTEDEKVVLNMMYHLDKFQTSLNEIESDVRPYLILKNRKIFDKYGNDRSAANNQIINLKALCGNKNIPCNDILVLESYLNNKISFFDSVVNLSVNGKPIEAIALMDGKNSNAAGRDLSNKFNFISDLGRQSLRAIEDQRNQQSQKIYTLFAIIIFITVVSLIFIFWRLIKQTAIKDQLLSQNKLFENIINTSSDSIIIYDDNFKITSCNKATEELYKLNKSEIIGKHTLDEYRIDYSEQDLEQRLDFLKKNDYWKAERSCKDAEGNVFDLITNANKIKNEQGLTEGYFVINTNITELKKAQHEMEEMALSLKKSNESLEARVKEQTSLLVETFDRVKAGFIATDADLNINYYNNIFIELLDIRERNISGKKLKDILSPSFGMDNIQTILIAFAEQEEKHFEFFYPKENRWYRTSIFPSVNGISIYMTDVTVRKKATEELEKSNRLYHFISDVNDLVTRAASADEIFTDICKIAVRSGGLSFAWIGDIDTETQNIHPIAWAGHEEGYIEVVKTISSKDIPEGRGPSGTAIREGQYYYSNDIAKDPAMGLWRTEALKRGYRSSIALPIEVDAKVAHVFTLYASRSNFFTDDEIALLVNVSKNVGHSLTTFSINDKRITAEKQLRKVMQAVEQSSSSIVITDLKGNIEYVNPAFSKLTGYSYEEAKNQNPRILKSGYTTDAEYTNLWNDITHHKEWQGIFRNKKKNGDYYWEYAIISPIENEAGDITNFVAVKENITGRKELEDEQKQLTKIIENSDAYVAITDLNRNLLYGNKALKNVLEIGEEEDISKCNLAEFRSDEGAKIIEQANEKLFKEGKWTGENIYVSRSGKIIPVLQVIVLHKNESDQPVHISTTAIDLSKVKENEKELLRINTEIRDFAAHLQKISETEKKEIAREIHDELGQNLTLIKFGASWLDKHIDDDKAIVKKKIDELLNEINSTMISFRKIHSSLHPAMLEEVGIHAAAEWLINSISKSSNIAILFKSNFTGKVVMKYEPRLAVYRILQESLTNIIRYSNATNASVTLNHEHDEIIMDIHDNGNGFDVSSVDKKMHHGILGMQERAYAFNGEFSINSVIGEGTFIYLKIPVS